MSRKKLAVSGVLIVLGVSLGLALWPWCGPSLLAKTGIAAASDRAAAVRVRVLPQLTKRLAPLGLKVGDSVFVRIFKQENELELWMQPKGRAYKLVHTYPICTYSGELGPKTRQGDGQAPEGFYSVRRAQLNPSSSYHLSFNLGYPNAFERAQGWTGNYLMVHGNCVSIGCYAMGDAAIEEIYTLLDAALQSGQYAVQVHALPFAFDAEHQQLREQSIHADFWSQLAEGYHAFERTQMPPKISVRGGHYVIEP
jgi:murein L,D-transpeptidase YafK